MAFLVALHTYDTKLFPYVFPDWLIIPISLINTIIPIFVTTVATVLSFVRGDSSVKKLKEAEKRQLEAKSRAEARGIRNTATLGGGDELEFIDLVRWN